MHTARVTWFGNEGKLHLQWKTLPSRREVRCRVGEITLPERKRHRDLLLITRSDGALINVGSLVPEEEAIKAIKACPVVADNHAGFFVHLPRGYGIVDNKSTHELNAVPAGEVPELSDPISPDDDDTAKVGAKASRRAMKKMREEDELLDDLMGD